MKKLIITVLILIISSSSLAYAKSTKMIFWYPGEAGSTKEAQPILELFFAYLNKKQPNLKLQGKYFNTVEDGVTFIKRKLPTLGIVSFPAWVSYKDKMPGAGRWLKVIPPHGKGTEQYTLYALTEKLKPHVTIYTSEPLRKSFIKKYLFPDIQKTFHHLQTDQILSKLRKIATGKTKSAAILTATETISFQRIQRVGLWAKRLKQIKISKPIPTPQFIIFDPNFKQEKELANALQAMLDDPQGREILHALRIKGFARWNSTPK